jgi:hypothetical protein
MSITAEASDVTPSGGIRRLICSKIVDLDRQYHHQRASNNRPTTNPKLQMTKTSKTRSDSIFVVRSAMRRLMADESSNIAKFIKSESGEPRSRI